MNGTAKARTRGLQAPAIITVVVTLAVGLVVTAVAIAGQVATIGPRITAGNSMALPAPTPSAGTTSATTGAPYVPPTASYSTPSLTASLAPPERPLTNEGISQIPTATAQPVLSTPPASTTPAARVSNIQLSCGRDGEKVVATLTFTASVPVMAVVSAGSDVKQRTASGAVTLVASTRSRTPAVCSAVVDNNPIGPIRPQG